MKKVIEVGDIVGVCGNTAVRIWKVIGVQESLGMHFAEYELIIDNAGQTGRRVTEPTDKTHTLFTLDDIEEARTLELRRHERTMGLFEEVEVRFRAL